MLDQQVRVRRMNVFQIQPTGFEDIFTITRTQGEVSGLQMAGVLLQTMIDEVSMEIVNLLEKERESDNG